MEIRGETILTVACFVPENDELMMTGARVIYEDPLPFVDIEDECLKIGIIKFGDQWNRILEDQTLVFQPTRTPLSLQMRARVLRVVKSLRVHVMSTGTQTENIIIDLTQE